MANVENVEDMVGTREAEMATESGGAATTDDATAGDEAAATGGVMYANEGPYTIAMSAMLKRWWGRLEKRRMATESGGDDTGDETGGPGSPWDETGDNTAPTAGDEQDGGDRWGNVYGRRVVRI